MLININKIQPIENLLIDTSIRYHLEDNSRIFNNPPRIVKCENQPFTYFALDGNNRLLSLYLSDLEIVPFKTEEFNHNDQDMKIGLECALETYHSGIRKWSDYKPEQIVTLEEYKRLMEDN
ncbi:hypothetical protein HN385_05870 [archaeon]|jgi:hypothetical protein|nr:hypothetical protein [archaeon]MBT3451113.1 hypothetical protein [archaeon]MBT6868643.1 hypothetical protein [archaeon]MBT7193390.1 hypothetical protein [archaeon]MBT7381440.1 hypothetical protein [archaeon]